MSIHSVDKTTGDITLLSGGTLWSDMPVGSIIPYGGTTAPEGALLCDGAEYLKADYPELFAVIGTSFGTPSENTKFKVPDLRETVPVGAGTSTRSGIATHDAYNVGEFKDDQFQDHAHKTHLKGLQYSEGALWATAYDQDVDGTTTTGAVSGRVGTTTHGKQLGVTYVIKAKQTALPADFSEQVEEVIEVKADKVSSATNGNFAGLDANGNLTDSGNKASDFLTAHQDISGKADKVSGATNGNFAGLNASGNLTDSGKKASDFATAIALANEAATRSAMGAKNLIPYPGRYFRTDGNPYTSNEVTYTQNADGSISATGTANGGNANVYLTDWRDGESALVKAGKYILSGCPSGGSTETYSLNFWSYEQDGTEITPLLRFYDTGNGVEINLARDVYARIYIRIVNGNAAPVSSFYPMLRLASDTDSTYQPFAKTNKELTDDKAEQDAVFNVYGSKNILPCPYIRESGYKTGGFVCTYDEDGVITVNGTYDTTTRQFALNASSLGSENLKLIAGKRYILSFEIEGFSETTYGVSIFVNINGSDVCAIRDATADGYYEKSFTLTAAQAEYSTIVVSTYYRSDSELSTVTSATVKPMLRLTDTDNTWEPYAKTNRVLTKNVAFNEYINSLGAKNMIPYPFYQTSQTVNGITITDNGDGTITLNGTCTASCNPFRYLPSDMIVHIPLEAKKYKLSFGLTNTIGASFHPCDVRVIKTDGTTYTYGAVYSDLTIDNTSGEYRGIEAMAVWAVKDAVFDNITIKPMLRPFEIEDDTWVSYAASNKKLTEEKASYKLLSEVGAKNILKFPFYNMSGTHRGITFTAADDGSVGFTGTANDANPAQLLIEAKANFLLKAGTYTLSDGGASDYGGMSIFFYNQDGTNYSGSYSGLLTNTSNNVYIMTTESGAQMNASNLYGYEKTFTIYSDAWVDIACRSATNVITSAVSGTIYPMLRRAEDTDSTYQPYAMTNQQLTKEVSALTAYHIRTLTRIDVKDYISTNKYTAISDGYVNFNGSAATESILNLDSIGLAASTSTSGRNALFVKKGMTIHFEGSTPTYAWFYPLD